MSFMEYRKTVEAMQPPQRIKEIESLRNSSACQEEIKVRTAIILSLKPKNITLH